MSDLIDYVIAHTERDDGLGADDAVPVSDMIFFRVRAKNSPSADKLRELIKAHQGDHNQVNLFDGVEHNYMELGGWIGDQGLALTLMGLGCLLGLWQLLTPRTMLGPFLQDAMVKQMAGAGFLSIQAKPLAATGASS